MRRRAATDEELLEYHQGPPAIVRDMEEWLAVGDRRASAERVRRWLLASYGLAPAEAGGTKVGPAPQKKRATPKGAPRRRITRGSSSR